MVTVLVFILGLVLGTCFGMGIAAIISINNQCNGDAP